jgi:membrane-bound serine protease (ClpP class)
VTGEEQMIGSRARVVDWHGQEGRVHVHGEVWRARGPTGLAPGQAVEVKAIEGLTLEVIPDREVTA